MKTVGNDLESQEGEKAKNELDYEQFRAKVPLHHLESGELWVLEERSHHFAIFCSFTGTEPAFCAMAVAGALHDHLFFPPFQPAFRAS